VPIRFTIAALTVASVLSAGCDGLGEREVRARFKEHKAEFEELRSMVQQDAETSDLRFLSADAADPTRCGEPEGFQACLSEDRRADYARRMRKAGVLWIDRQQDPARTYFVLYHRAILMDARLRGVVHTSDGVDVGRLHPHQEWRTISERWHTYLMIDS
jgi:hypothetical protein